MSEITSARDVKPARNTTDVLRLAEVFPHGWGESPALDGAVLFPHCRRSPDTSAIEEHQAASLEGSSVEGPICCAR